MPKLPKYESQTGVPGVSGPRVMQVDAPRVRPDLHGWGRATDLMVQAGNTMSAVAEQLYKAEAGRKLDSAKVGIMKRLSELNRDTDNRSDWQMWDKDLDKEMKNMREEFVKTMPNRESTQELENFLELHGNTMRDTLFTKGMKIRVDQGAAGVFKDAEDLKDSIHNAGDLLERVRLKEELKHIYQKGASDLFLSNVKSLEAYENDLDAVQTNVARKYARAMGYEAGIEAVKNGTIIGDEEMAAMEFRPMNDTEKDALVADLKREWADVKAQTKDAEEKEFEAINRNFVKLMDEGKLTKEAVLASNLKPEGQLGQQWWIAALNKRADEILAGKGDPYANTTDFEGYGLLMEQVMQDPESVTDEDLWSHHGVGIGTADMYRLQAVRDGKLAKDPEQKALHKRWSSHLSFARKSGIWDGGTSNKAKERNNKRYMELQATLDEMFAANPDLSNKEVQEWWDNAITPDEKSWFSKKIDELKQLFQGADISFSHPYMQGMAGFFSDVLGEPEVEAEDPKRREAINLLRSKGKLVNEDTIKAVMERMK